MFDDDHIRSIAERFGIPCQGIERPPHAILPTVFILDRAYVLRVRPLSHRESFERSVDLLLEAAPRIPLIVAVPMPAPGGHRFVADGPFLWHCASYIPGRPLGTWQGIHDASDDDTEHVLEALREMHERTRGITLHGVFDQHHFTGDMGEKLKKIRHLLSPHAGRRIVLALERARAHEEKVHTADRSFIHGDFHHGNVIADEEKHIQGLIDFDFCRIGHPFEDAGFTISMLLRSFDADGFRFDPLYYQKCLQWYGVPLEQESLFVEYLLLASLIDMSAFADEEEYAAMQDRTWYLHYQISLIQDLCSRFGGTDERSALPAREIDAKFPVDLPEGVLALAHELGVRPHDVSEHFVRGSGHGGQKINKTSSCVELTHEPTRIAVRVQQHREQHKNRIAAWKLLIAKIEEVKKGNASARAQENFRIRKQKQRRSRKTKEKILREKKIRGDVKKLRQQSGN